MLHLLAVGVKSARRNRLAYGISHPGDDRGGGWGGGQGIVIHMEVIILVEAMLFVAIVLCMITKLLTMDNHDRVMICYANSWFCMGVKMITVIIMPTVFVVCL